MSDKMTTKTNLPTIHVVAQSHIDLAWLWRWDPETVQVCCKKTFGIAVENLDKFPEYKFTQSQPPLYEATEFNHPEIFKKIEQYIKENRWELAGAMYVEAEGGEPSGESLVRQCIHGKHYFLKRFGKNVTTAWQEDSWSHPWQLPQIYKLCGVDAYFFKRGKQDPQIFWWESPDGTRLLSINPVNILHGFRDLHDAPRLNKWIDKNLHQYNIQNIMVRIGRGDHGGGPKVSEIQKVLKFGKKNSTKYNVVFDTFENYKDALLKESGNLPVIKDEIGNELQGDLTNCSEIKQNNRMCENLLLDIEKIATIASIASLTDSKKSYVYPHEEIYCLWNKLLFNQFHDIIGGSCIPEANQDAFQLYDEIKNKGYELLLKAFSVLNSNSSSSQNKNQKLVGVRLFNSLSWDRSDIVKIKLGISDVAQLKEIEIKDTNGVKIPFQISPMTDSTQVTFLANMPSCGVSHYYIQSDILVDILGQDGGINQRIIQEIYSTDCDLSVFTPKSKVFEGIKNQIIELENPFFQIKINSATGNLTEIYDKRLKFNILDDSQQGNALIAIADDGDSEGRFKRGSDIIDHPLGERSQILLEYGAGNPLNFELVESGPIFTKFRIHKKYQNSRFIQDIMLNNSKATIDFDLSMDWHDLHTMIKVLFPIRPSINEQNPTVTYHTAYGTIEHPPNGSEYPMQNWVDLSYKTPQEYGITLINRVRNACDVTKNTIGLSVLRSPTQPSPNNEEGYHILKYSLYPHDSSWKSASVMQMAAQFNTYIIPIIEKCNTDSSRNLIDHCSFFRISPNNVIIEVIKPSYIEKQNDIILRCYEFAGKNSDATIESHFPIENAYKTDLLEENKMELLKIESSQKIRFKMHAYEILTIRLTLK
jgi:alpha-mannosidase